MKNWNKVTEQIIGAAIEVHRILGPGCLESVYETCLAHELSLRGIAFERQKVVHVVYKGVRMECGFRLDLLVEGGVVVELKAVHAPDAVHEAQLFSHMKLLGVTVGLLLNFKVPVLKDGIRRKVLNFRE